MDVVAKIDNTCPEDPHELAEMTVLGGDTMFLCPTCNRLLKDRRNHDRL